MQSQNNLPVTSIFINSIYKVAANYRQILWLSLPFIVINFSEILMSEGEVTSEPRFSFPMFLYFVIYCTTAILAIVALHKIFLLPENEQSNLKPFRWSSDEASYLISYIKISFIVIIISIPLFLAAGFFNDVIAVEESSTAFTLFFGLASLPIIYVFARYSLLLPAAAIGLKGKTTGWAWDLSKGNSLRLSVLLVAIPMVTAYLFGLVYFDSLIFSLLLQFVYLVVVAIEICLLSLSFQWFYKMQQASIEL